MKKRILSAIVMIIIFIPILLIGGKSVVVVSDSRVSELACPGVHELNSISPVPRRIKPDSMPLPLLGLMSR